MNSYWEKEYNISKYASLKRDLCVDVCIIGGGITGIMTAYMLKDSNLKICVIDSNRLCNGTTINTTAKITVNHGLIYKYLIDNFKKDFALKYLEVNEQAILDINSIINNEKISCDFKWADNYIYTCKEEYIQKIRDEILALDNLGKKADFVTETELPFKILGGLKTERQAMFNPVKYLNEIVAILNKRKIEFYENTRVLDITKENEYIVKTKNNIVKAKKVVIATHYPINNFPGEYFLKMYQEASNVIAIEKQNHNIQGMYISAEDKTSFRPLDKDILLVGSGSHKVGDNTFNVQDIYTNLINYSDEIFGDFKLLNMWENQDCITLDKVPYIGEIADDMYVATGYNKWGMTNSHIAAKIISDKILERENKYSSIYDPKRIGIIKNYGAISEMVKESYNSLIKNRVKNTKYTIKDIGKDQGGVIEEDGEKVGIYIDEKGKEYRVKPICKHLGCLLTWNNLDKTWDCPCHGSKYDYLGNVIYSPTVQNLDKI